MRYVSSESGEVGDFSLTSFLSQEAYEICLSSESGELGDFSLISSLSLPSSDWSSTVGGLMSYYSCLYSTGLQ